MKLIGALWNTLYRKDIIKPEDFCFTIYGEDGALSSMAYAKAKRVFYLKEPVYHYYQNEDSITMHMTKMNYYHSLNSLYFIYDNLSKREDYDTYKDAINFYLAKRVLGDYCRLGMVEPKEERKAIAQSAKLFYELSGCENNCYLKENKLFALVEKFFLNDLLRPVVYQESIKKIANASRLRYAMRYKIKSKTK